MFDIKFPGTYRQLQHGEMGIIKLSTSLLHLGGIFTHSPLLVRHVRPSDKAPPDAQYVVIDGNHRLHLFTHPYPKLFLLLPVLFFDFFK